ncbi:MAG: membrane protein insertase YidC [Wolinella sp.]
MFNKLDKLSLQVRILIATTLSLLFFIPYSYFFAPPTPKESTTNAPRAQLENRAPVENLSVDSQVLEQKIAPQGDVGDVIARVYAKQFRLEIDSLGRISQIYLKEAKYLRDTKELALLDPLATLRPLEVRFADSALNAHSRTVRYSADRSSVEIGERPETIILTQELGKARLTKHLTIYPNGRYDLSIDMGESKERLYLSPGSRPVAESDRFAFSGVVVKESDQTIHTTEDGDAPDKSEVFEGAFFVASADRYYTSLLYTPKKEGMRVIIGRDSSRNPEPFIEASGSLEVSGFLGAKEYHTLKNINPMLTDVVEYGFITFFARPLFLLLDWLYRYCGNWGWAIVLLTLIVRIVLFPLTYKGMVSMQKLKDIAPKMKEIQEKYKGDPQKLQIHMMELYKKHDANPMGGCLPLLLQMPIFFAIYRVLYNAIELKGAEWEFWIVDLSAMDPYFVLPLLMGISMYVQQHLTPTTFSDPMQEKVFKFLPVIFTFFFVTFPSGLVLYWFVSNVFSIAQQLFINKHLENKKHSDLAEHKARS